MFLKIFYIIFALLYQTVGYTKTSDKNDFNYKYLSSYFSALISFDNQKNNKALEFFESSKYLKKKHNNYLKEYVYSLVLDGQIKKAVNQIKSSRNTKNSNFFEGKLLIVLDLMNKKKYVQASKVIKTFNLSNENTYEFIIIKTLESFNNLFKNKKLQYSTSDFGKLSLIVNAFQNCYLNSNKTDSHFLNLINSAEGDYSRYLFFYLSNVIVNKDYKTAKQISKTIEPFSSTLLISQSKKWIDNENYKKFKKHFSCQNENDLLSEFFFLISNLYSSQNIIETSNFYLSVSNYLNPKFYFNLSLLAENYYDNNNFDISREILEKFSSEDEIYFWYKIKKIAQIISEEENDDKSLKYIEDNISDLKQKSPKILFDLANIYKNFENYKIAIDYYTQVLNQIDKNSNMYADVLYRRGGTYERLKNYSKADKDLLMSLNIRPDHAYTLNYLSYSWLERNIKIEKAMKMLMRAYELRENDPYITDSVGWGYYLIGDFINAEKYLRKAVELMPDDPIVNDHYGDVLWQLDRKLQAKYFWEHVLELEDTEEEMKKDIENKLIDGPRKI
ncbi:tetratricopeptide repeat protein [Candidatus Pelagibacter sp. RS40]|uniref:tetratricopeptide repeat protein n=1 Tax=Candidatus Pelagibacter sp. RS40 TaxID=1977865 RepID=UPI000A15C6AA|nr:hypothetical protein [Candidatus Pelagibacter sp. RS40]ARJ48832.1 hypothetical protein B8063_02085 [Candidatus Pelagibacter sp. RS40]